MTACHGLKRRQVVDSLETTDMKSKQYDAHTISIPAKDIDRQPKSIDIHEYVDNDLCIIRIINSTSLTVLIDVLENNHPITVPPQSTINIDPIVTTYGHYIFMKKLFYKKLVEDCTLYDLDKALSIIFITPAKITNEIS